MDLSHCPKLQRLHCSNNNPLTELDLSHCPNLKILYCSYNQLTELHLSYCPELQILYCYNNQLEKLDILKNDKLTFSNWKDNPIYSEETNTIKKMKQYNRNNYCSEYILK